MTVEFMNRVDHLVAVHEMDRISGRPRVNSILAFFSDRTVSSRIPSRRVP